MITPSFALTATERVLPKLALDFTTASLDSRVTFTRSGATATYTDSNGYIALAGVDVPRFDYDPVTLVCKGLLIEEARTNLLSYSQDFRNTADAGASRPWVYANSIITPDAAIAPDNTTTSEKLVANTSTATHSVSYTYTTTAQPYTLTVYAKQAEKNIVALQLTNSTNNNRRVYYNLAAGTVGTVGADLTASISDAGNGYYRCSATITTAYAGSNNVAIIVCNVDGSPTWAGNDSDGLYIWGAQLEAGAFATSYIPTTTAQVTRTADNAVIQGSDFTNFWNPSEGTFVAVDCYPNATSGRPISVDNGTSANQIIMAFKASKNIVALNGGSLILNSGQYVADGSCTIAYKANSYAQAANGIGRTTHTTSVVPSLTKMGIGSRPYDGLSNICGTIGKINYYPQRLTNNEVSATSKG